MPGATLWIYECPENTNSKQTRGDHRVKETDKRRFERNQAAITPYDLQPENHLANSLRSYHSGDDDIARIKQQQEGKERRDRQRFDRQPIPSS